MTVTTESRTPERIHGSALTADERDRFVWMLGAAIDRVFPPALGAPQNLLGASPAQDFYFRRLLARLAAHATSTGIAAVTGSFDDVWRFVDDHYDAARRECGRRTLRCNRETVRVFLVFQWRSRFKTRSYRFDARAFDSDPATQGTTFEFVYSGGSESSPFALSARALAFKRDDDSIVDIDVPSELPAECSLPAFHLRDVPPDDVHRREHARVLLRALRRSLNGPRDVMRELRRLSNDDNFDLELTIRLQALLRRARSEGVNTDLIDEVRRTLDEPGPDVRTMHGLVDRFRHASSVDRKAVIQTLIKAAKTAGLCVLVLALIAYFSPTKVGAALRERVQRFFDRLVMPDDEFFRKKVTVDRTRAEFISPTGDRSASVVTGDGVSALLSPLDGGFGVYSHERTTPAQHEKAIQERVVAFGDLETTGLIVSQERVAANGPIIPWKVNILLRPRQDGRLASETTSGKTIAQISYSPAPKGISPVAPGRGIRYISDGRELTWFHQRDTLPAIAAVYDIEGRVTRSAGHQEVYRGVLTMSSDGIAHFVQNTAGVPLINVQKKWTEYVPAATAIVDSPPGWFHPAGISALALVDNEQFVMFAINCEKQIKTEQPYTVDFGDGTHATDVLIPGLPLSSFNHQYRVGNRTYVVRVFFDELQTVYEREIFVFSNKSYVTLPTGITLYTAPLPYDYATYVNLGMAGFVFRTHDVRFQQKVDVGF